MQKHPKEKTEKSAYVLVFDLGSKIKALRQLGLKTPEHNDPFFLEIQTDLTKMISQALPDAEILAYEMEDLSYQILTRAHELRKILVKDAVVVSSCLEIAAPRRGFVLEINRLVDFDGQILGIGPRPGCPTISEQIRGIKTLVADRPVIIVEDGSFSGRTLAYVLKLFKESGVQVAALVLGFMFPQALASLRRSYEGEMIVIRELNNVIDWMPDHDFFPFSPNCGRVVGVSVHGLNYPFFNYDGASYGVPYILPFSPMHDWASIPKDSCNEISLYCMHKTLELFDLLEKMNNGKEIKIGDLTGARPLVSVPISVRQKFFPSLDTRVRSFLHDTCHELA